MTSARIVPFGLPITMIIDVASNVLLVPSKRAVKIGLLYSVYPLEGFCEEGGGSDGFFNDALDFSKEGIFSVEMKILLAPTCFRGDESLAFEMPKLL
jgi:hypothetical protein